MKQALVEAEARAADAAAIHGTMRDTAEAARQQHAKIQARAESAEAACAVAELLHEDHLEQMQVLIGPCNPWDDAHQGIIKPNELP